MYRLTPVFVFAMALCMATGAFAFVGHGYSVVWPLNTAPPIFENVTAMPPQAREGDTVIITFSASTNLLELPIVKVNNKNVGVEETNGNYTCYYVVDATDIPGMAAIAVSGFDALGNPGTLTDTQALEILGVIHSLPIRAHAIITGLILVGGIVILLRSRRFGVTVFAITVFLLPMAMLSDDQAVAPAVTNVTLYQGPDGTGNTKVDIYFDLETPNGPCDITVALSKDGGADSYVFPINAVVSNLAGLDNGRHHIEWAIAIDYPAEFIPQAQVRITADDGFSLLTYAAGPGGIIDGNQVQSIGYERDGETVEAVPGEGYHFVNWSDGVETPVRQDTAIITDISVTATFAPNTYTITFEAPDGTPPNPAVRAVTFDAPYGELPVTERTGYHFAGWFTDPDDGDLITEETTVSFAANHTLYAHWIDLGFCTVSFNAQGGSAPNPGSKTVQYGEVYGPLPQSLRTGYTLTGWFTSASGGTEVAAGTIVPTDNNHTLYAQWNANSYEVIFDAQGGNLPDPLTKDVIFDATYGALAAVSRSGYTFNGWWTAPTGGAQVTPDMSVIIAANHTLYARWTANQCMVTFDSQSGSAANPAAKSVVYDSPYGALASTSRAGYTFLGWWTTPGGGTRVFPTTLVATDENHTLYARWNANTYVVSFNPQGGTTPVPASMEVLFGMRYDTLGPLPTTTLSGHTFAGWFTAASGGLPVNGDTIVTLASNHTLYAQWIAPNQFTVAFDARGGITPEPPSKSVTLNNVYGPLATTSRTGYGFSGWWTSPEGGVQVLTTTIVTTPSNHTLYARWNANTYTLSYAAGANGTISGNSSQTVEHGSDGTPVTAVPDTGYFFRQWSDNSGAATRQDTNVQGNISVTASFSQVYITSFNINGGETFTSNSVVTLNSVCAGSPTQFMVSYDSDFGGASWQPYSPSASFTLSGEAIAHKVYFRVRNASEISNVVNATIFTMPVMLTVAGGAFDMGQHDPQNDEDDDALPVHTVTLDAYTIGKYPVTNQQYCDVLNWAMSRNYLFDNQGGLYDGADPYSGVFAGASGASRHLVLAIDNALCDILFADGVFKPKQRTGVPSSHSYSMATHPVVMVSWYGAAAFCNWLSEIQGLPPAYDASAEKWPLTWPPTDGYRLPTEAEWERAAAWNAGSGKHWQYGISADVLSGNQRVNYRDRGFLSGGHVNPLGLEEAPYTSPVGWYNGLNISPNGNVATQDSKSPIGCYDMCGNVFEWCQDWYASDYYATGGPWINPVGPASGVARVARGGSWQVEYNQNRSAWRANYMAPVDVGMTYGFRVARTP